MVINKEGRRIVRTTLAACIVAAALCGLLLPLRAAMVAGGALLLPGLFVVRFFRDPKRSVLTDPAKVFSPCDGEVVVVEEVDVREAGLGRCLQISVFMSIWNVHCNWLPVGGKVVYTRHHPGKYLVAWLPKSSELNEHTTTIIETAHGRVGIRQIAGFVARRIVCYAREGGAVKQNARLGFIKFGSRCDILLPPGATPLVKIGDRVVGSQSRLAEF